ncbi:hypothetical protein FRC08_000120 [Ceratobasidium sp. 394]|nr:hypothetical protein FRC08_000120 [Ceratobasidium sp. 394]
MGTVTAAVTAELASTTPNIAAQLAASAARLISAANTDIIAIVRSGEVATSAAARVIAATIRLVYMTATGCPSHRCPMGWAFPEFKVLSRSYLSFLTFNF